MSTETKHSKRPASQRKRGRPFGTTKEPTERLNIRLKAGTVEALENEAKSHGKTLKEWLEAFKSPFRRESQS